MKHSGPHKYQLIKVRKLKDDGSGTFSEQISRVLYKCVLPDCAHFLPSIELALGRLSLCHGGCGQAVKLNQKNIRELTQRPMCDACREKRRLIRERAKLVG